MEAHKRTRNPKYKSKYQGVNWSEYEKSLRNRGNICLWSPKGISSLRSRHIRWSDQKVEFDFQKETRRSTKVLWSCYRNYALHSIIISSYTSKNRRVCLFPFPIDEAWLANSRPHHTLQKNSHTGSFHQKQTSIRKTDALDSGQHRIISSWRRTLVRTQTWQQKNKRLEKTTHSDWPKWFHPSKPRHLWKYKW